ncbi:MAG: polyprenyl synthetase family protein [Thermoplasmata archaeon]
MVLNEYLNKYPKLVENYLREFFEEKKKRLEDPYIVEVFDAIYEYTMRGGKRLRPLLMIVGYKLYGGEDEEEIIKASASIEIVQSFLLIHDDIMDNSDLRRGKPTIHKIFENKYNNKKLGENLAIIAGDLASMYSYEIFENLNFPEERKIKAMLKMTKIIEDTGYGQILDVLSFFREDFNEKDLLKIHEYKTAKYTIEGPMIMGAILAGSDNFDMITNYAIPVGIAFQLQDDILGLFGDEKEIGKPVTSDLEEGKKTLLIIKAMENEKFKDTIMKYLGKKGITIDELNEVRNAVKESGSLEYSYMKLEELVKIAQESIKPIDNEVKRFLYEFAEYVVKRKY